MKQSQNVRKLCKQEKNNLDQVFGNFKSSISDLNDVIKRKYAIEKEIAKESILFISMNPSYQDGAWNNGTKGGDPAIYKIPDKNAAKDDTNTFFQAINKFYINLGDNIPPLAHHDLLFIRETSQKKVLEWKEKLEKEKNTFFADQLSISKKIIIETQPKIIIVINAGARDLFKKLFDEDCNPSFCDKLGAKIYRFNDNNIPVLFSGMLSGRHPLDLGSKESLSWHIKYILNNI